VHRSGVGHIGEESPEGENPWAVEPFNNAAQLFGEQPPAQGGLGSEHEDCIGAG
jgi:hypothetical protein